MADSPFLVEVFINGEPVDDILTMRMSVVEEASGAFSVDFVAFIPTQYDPYETLYLRDRFVVRITDRRLGTTRQVSGFVFDLDTRFDTQLDGHVITARCRPKFFLLDSFTEFRAFENRTAREIIERTLRDHNARHPGTVFTFGPRADVEFVTDDTPRPLEFPFTVQLEETTGHFIRRIAQEGGLTYYFDWNLESANMVFLDDLRNAPANDRPLTFTGDLQKTGLSDLTLRFQHFPETVHVQNYVPTRGEEAIALKDEIPFGIGAFQDGRVDFQDTAQGERVLHAVVSEKLSNSLLFTGRYDGIGVFLARRHRIVGHPQFADLDLHPIRVAWTYVNHQFRHGEAMEDAYHEDFVAAPRDYGVLNHPVRKVFIDKDVRFRPARTLEKPRVAGFHLGRIEAAPDRLERSIDALGRYRVRLYHDPALQTVRDETRWPAYPSVRMMQPVGGTDGANMHFPLHPGTEVAVGFHEGDADRPYITGALPNARDRTSVTEGNARLNRIRTAAGNRLEMADPPGSATVEGTKPIWTLIDVPYDGGGGVYARYGQPPDTMRKEMAEKEHAGLSRPGIFVKTMDHQVGVTEKNHIQVTGGHRTDVVKGNSFEAVGGAPSTTFDSSGYAAMSTDLGKWDLGWGAAQMDTVSTLVSTRMRSALLSTDFVAGGYNRTNTGVFVDAYVGIPGLDRVPGGLFKPAVIKFNEGEDLQINFSKMRSIAYGYKSEFTARRDLFSSETINLEVVRSDNAGIEEIEKTLAKVSKFYKIFSGGLAALMLTVSLVSTGLLIADLVDNVDDQETPWYTAVVCFNLIFATGIALMISTFTLLSKLNNAVEQLLKIEQTSRLFINESSVTMVSYATPETGAMLEVIGKKKSIVQATGSMAAPDTVIHHGNGQITLKASAVIIDAPHVTVTGDLLVGGAVTPTTLAAADLNNALAAAQKAEATKTHIEASLGFFKACMTDEMNRLTRENT